MPFLRALRWSAIWGGKWEAEKSIGAKRDDSVVMICGNCLIGPSVGDGPCGRKNSDSQDGLIKVAAKGANALDRTHLEGGDGLLFERRVDRN